VLLQPSIRELLDCPICLEVLQNAKSLPCIHTFCLHCLEDYWKDKEAGQQVFCPVCRGPFDIPQSGLDSGLPNNFMVQKLMEIGSVSSDSCISQLSGAGKSLFVIRTLIHCIDVKRFLRFLFSSRYSFFIYK